MRIARRHDRFAQIFSCGFEGKTVGNLKRRRQKSFRENFLHGCGGLRHSCKGSGEGRARGRQWQQSQRDFGDNAEHSFRTNKKPDQIEAGFVFVHPSAGP